MRLLRLLALGTIALTCAPAAGSTARSPAGFRQDVVAGGLRMPTSLAFLPGGRILVAEKRGLVRLVDGGRIARRPFLDLRRRVNTFNERGLMAIGVHGGFLYAYYALETRRRAPREPTGMRLSRFRIRGDRAARGSERVLLGRRSRDGCRGRLAHADCIPANCGCHVGGDIRFGPDGTIFLSTGDAANAGSANPSGLRAQDLDSLAGKLLRVRANGSGLRTNPFAKKRRLGANRSKVWALGLRNPFRFRLQPGTGVPVVADVGWLDWEELDLAARGVNLGWPCYEGPAVQRRYARFSECRHLVRRPPGRLRRPAYAYGHRHGASIVGGVFGRELAFPRRLRGAYFFADYVHDWIRYLPSLSVKRPRARPFLRRAGGPVALEPGPAGDLYYLALRAGELRRVRYVPRGGGRPVSRPATS